MLAFLASCFWICYPWLYSSSFSIVLPSVMFFSSPLSGDNNVCHCYLSGTQICNITSYLKRDTKKKVTATNICKKTMTMGRHCGTCCTQCDKPYVWTMLNYLGKNEHLNLLGAGQLRSGGNREVLIKKVTG